MANQTNTHGSEQAAKHTPGPWGIDQTDRNNWIGPLRIDGRVERVVVDTDRDGLKPEALERNDADAKLIAAAPDLLAVARMALTPERDAYDQYDQWHARLKELATTAIAKAEGSAAR